MELPTIQGLARHIIALHRKYPDTNIMLTKRDTKSAFRPIRMHPQMSKVMVTEFPGEIFGMHEDILCFYGVLPFGWGGSPGHFCRFSDAITLLHSLCGPARPLWNTAFAYKSHMYIDDGLFIEIDVGDRTQQSTEAWERIAKDLLSNDAINEEKNEIEGQWQDEHIFLGFLINTESTTISLPEEKEPAPQYSPMKSSRNSEAEI